jgi:hypothetical protein
MEADQIGESIERLVGWLGVEVEAAIGGDAQRAGRQVDVRVGTRNDASEPGPVGRPNRLVRDHS